MLKCILNALRKRKTDEERHQEIMDMLEQLKAEIELAQQKLNSLQSDVATLVADNNEAKQNAVTQVEVDAVKALGDKVDEIRASIQ